MKLTSEEVELFELAYLLRTPLYKLKQEMPYEELLGWFAYFRQRPPEWRADHRAAAIIQSSGAKVDINKVFPSLKAISSSPNEGDALRGLKGSAMFMHMLQAKGGDKINLED